MNCENFITWLENRDTHDISEADKARRHAAQCPQCRRLLAHDEALDRHIGTMLAREITPAKLRNMVDLNLDRTQPRRGGKSLWALAAAFCVVLIAVVRFQGWIPGGFEDEPLLSMEQLSNYILADYQDHGEGGMGFDPVTDAYRWLNENLHATQPPPEIIVAGYTVKAARYCYLGQCLAVHLIYEKDGKLISVFVVEKKKVDTSLENDRLQVMAIGDKNIIFSSQRDYLYAAIGS